MDNGTEKVGAVVARLYDEIEASTARLAEADGEDGPYHVKLMDVVITAPVRVFDKDGAIVGGETMVLSSCPTYTTEGILLQGARRLAE